MKRVILLLLVALVMGGCTSDYDIVEPFQVTIAEYLCDDNWKAIDNEAYNGNFEFNVYCKNGSTYRIGYKANSRQYDVLGNEDPVITETIHSYMTEGLK